MEDWSYAPEEILGLVADLRAKGFTVRSSRIGDAINQVVELWDEGEVVAVRVGADRGRWWSTIGPAGSNDFFPPSAWAAHLDGRPIGAEMSMTETVEFVRHRAGEAVQTARRDPELPGRLRRAQEAWVRAHLGLPPAK